MARRAPPNDCRPASLRRTSRYTVGPPLGGALTRVRGRVSAGAALNRITWFRVGGPAELMIRPVDVDDLAVVLAAKPADVPLTVIGVGSNLLVRDGGIPGITLRLGRGFAEIEAEEGCFIRAGAAALDTNVANVARDHGIAGLEFLTGIPGTIGGALRMNAGAHGREIKDILVTAEALDPSGRLHTLQPDDMHLSYRHCGVPEDWVFVAATLKGEPGKADEIAARLEEIRAQREASQPIRTRTGGSTFANPEGHSAWKLVDAAGCRGLTIGGRTSQREAHQLPYQHRLGHRRRSRVPGRRGPPAREGNLGRRTALGNSPRRRTR